MRTTLLILSVILALGSALSWWRGAVVKVTREQALEKRKREAMKRGEQPYLGGVELDGWEMSETFAAQSTWNARGAILAGLSVLGQAVSSFF